MLWFQFSWNSIFRVSIYFNKSRTIIVHSINRIVPGEISRIETVDTYAYSCLCIQYIPLREIINAHEEINLIYR